MSETKKYELTIDLRPLFAKGTIKTAERWNEILLPFGLTVKDSTCEWRPVCATCEKPLRACAGEHDHSFCRCATVEPPLPYPSCDLIETADWYHVLVVPIRPSDREEFQRIASLLGVVFRNRRNRDVRPLRDGEECWWALSNGDIGTISHYAGTRCSHHNWRTRAEAEDLAALLRALLTDGGER